jgi:hypothetical protein
MRHAIVSPPRLFALPFFLRLPSAQAISSPVSSHPLLPLLSSRSPRYVRDANELMQLAACMHLLPETPSSVVVAGLSSLQAACTSWWASWGGEEGFGGVKRVYGWVKEVGGVIKLLNMLTFLCLRQCPLGLVVDRYPLLYCRPEGPRGRDMQLVNMMGLLIEGVKNLR